MATVVVLSFKNRSIKKKYLKLSEQTFIDYIIIIIHIEFPIYILL